MKFESKIDQFYYELVAFAKEYWFEVAILCLGISVVFWAVIAFFNW